MAQPVHVRYFALMLLVVLLSTCIRPEPWLMFIGPSPWLLKMLLLSDARLRALRPNGSLGWFIGCPRRAG